MNWNRLEGEWKQRRGRATHHWGKMMNDELAAIAGKYEELVGGLQEKYGIAEEEAKHQVDEFKKKVERLKESNTKLTEAQKALSKKKMWRGRTVKFKSLPKKRLRSKSTDKAREER